MSLGREVKAARWRFPQACLTVKLPRERSPPDRALEGEAGRSAPVSQPVQPRPLHHGLSQPAAPAPDHALPRMRFARFDRGDLPGTQLWVLVLEILAPRSQATEKHPVLRTHARTHMHTCAHTCTCMHACTHMSSHFRTHARTPEHTCTHMHSHFHTHAHTCVRTCTHMHTHAHTAHTHMHTVRTCTHTCTRAHTHTCVHTHARTCSRSPRQGTGPALPRLAPEASTPLSTALGTAQHAL